MNIIKLFTEWKDLKRKNIVLQDDMDRMMDEMARIRLENRAYDAELGTTANKILKLRCELNNLRHALALDTDIKREQRKQWARDKAPELMEIEDFNWGKSKPEVEEEENPGQGC